MGQLKMVVAAFVSDGRLVFCQRAACLLVALGAFHLARQFRAQLPGLAQILFVELRALVAFALIVDEKILQSEVEAAAFTRAGFWNDDLLKNAEDKPQSAHPIALDGQLFNLPADVAMFHKLVRCTAYRDRMPCTV